MVSGEGIAARIRALLIEHPDWSQKRVAEEVGCPTSTVSHVHVREGVRKQRLPVDRDLVAAVAAKHPTWTQKRLAEELDVSESAVWRALKGTPVSVRADVDWSEMRAVIEEHPDWTYERVAEVLGCSSSHVSHAAVTAGVPTWGDPGGGGQSSRRADCGVAG